MCDTFEPRLETLPDAQRRLWDELGEVPDHFTLYGGTAIALRLGHRYSVDFDFFAFQAIEPDKLLQSLDFLRGAEVSQLQDNTLTCIVDRGDPVLVSFFGVPKLARLMPPTFTTDIGLPVAELIDLAGTKVSVIQRRAAVKDYLDMDALIASGVSLPHALAAGAALYGGTFNPQVTLKALSYYDDGDLADIPQHVRDRLQQAVRAVDPLRLPVLDLKT